MDIHGNTHKCCEEAEDLRAELARVTVERDEAMGTLAGLSCFLAVGVGDDNTTAKQYDERIRQGIELVVGPIQADNRRLREALERVAEAARQMIGPKSIALLRALADLDRIRGQKGSTDDRA